MRLEAGPRGKPAESSDLEQSRGWTVAMSARALREGCSGKGTRDLPTPAIIPPRGSVDFGPRPKRDQGPREWGDGPRAPRGETDPNRATKRRTKTTLRTSQRQVATDLSRNDSKWRELRLAVFPAGDVVHGQLAGIESVA